MIIFVAAVFGLCVDKLFVRLLFCGFNTAKE